MHNSLSRWLAETSYQPQDIWRATQAFVLNHPYGVLVADETVIDKSKNDQIDTIRFQNSGN